jgi:hypothetical protein
MTTKRRKNIFADLQAATATPNTLAGFDKQLAPAQKPKASLQQAARDQAAKKEIIARGKAAPFSKIEEFKNDARTYDTATAKHLARIQHRRALDQLREGRPLSQRQLANAGEDGVSQSRLADMSGSVTRMNMLRGARTGQAYTSSELRAQGLTDEQIAQFRAGGGKVWYGRPATPKAIPLDRRPGAADALAQLKAENTPKQASLAGVLARARRLMGGGKAFAVGVGEGLRAGPRLGKPTARELEAIAAANAKATEHKHIFQAAADRLNAERAPTLQRMRAAIEGEKGQLLDDLVKHVKLTPGNAKRVIRSLEKPELDDGRLRRLASELDARWRIQSGVDAKAPSLLAASTDKKDLLRASLFADKKLWPTASGATNRLLQLRSALADQASARFAAKAVDPKLQQAASEAEAAALKIQQDVMKRALPPAGSARRAPFRQAGRVAGAYAVPTLAGGGALLAGGAALSPYVSGGVGPIDLHVDAEPPPAPSLTDDVKARAGDVKNWATANPWLAGGIAATGLGAVAAYHLMKNKKRRKMAETVSPALTDVIKTAWWKAVPLALGGAALAGVTAANDLMARDTAAAREHLKAVRGEQLAAIGAARMNMPVAPATAGKPPVARNKTTDILLPSMLLAGIPLLGYHLMSRKIEEDSDQG